MFGTLQWKSHTKEPEFVERLHGSLDLEKNSACDRCRAKKVMSYESDFSFVKKKKIDPIRYES